MHNTTSETPFCDALRLGIGLAEASNTVYIEQVGDRVYACAVGTALLAEGVTPFSHNLRGYGKVLWPHLPITLSHWDADLNDWYKVCTRTMTNAYLVGHGDRALVADMLAPLERFYYRKHHGLPLLEPVMEHEAENILT